MSCNCALTYAFDESPMMVLDGGFVSSGCLYSASAIYDFKVEDESNLIYMRARYYDPTSGRFLSQDPKMNGINWLIYACDQPTDKIDQSGRDDSWEILSLAGNVMLLVGQLMMGGYPTSADDLCNALSVKVADFLHDRKLPHGILHGFWAIIDSLKAMIDLGQMASDEGADLGGQAVTSIAGYEMCIEGALLLCESDIESGGQGENWGFDPNSLIPESLVSGCDEP